jgi:hypothetical protein
VSNKWAGAWAEKRVLGRLPGAIRGGFRYGDAPVDCGVDSRTSRDDAGLRALQVAPQ